MTVAVTGATGRLGSRVSRLLGERGIDHLALARDPSRLPARTHAEPRGPAAYDDGPAMTAALAGARTLFLVSANLSGRRLEEHATVIEAAQEAGVRRVVYLSLLGAAQEATYLNARDHAATEEHLAGTALAWTVLRPSYYPDMLGRFAEDGLVSGPGGRGRCAFLGHDDLAEVAVEVLLGAAYDGRVLAVTGPEALTLEEACAAAGLRYEDVEGPDAPADRTSWFRSIARGELAEVADTVPRLTGHPARSVADVLDR